MASSRIGALAALALIAVRAAPLAAQQPVVGRPDTTAQADTARRVDEHPQDSPEDRGFVIRTSDGKLRLRLLGSLRTLATYDGEGLPGTDNFSPYDIPVPDQEANNNRFLMDARQTRIGFEATAPGTKGGHSLFARIEADFKGSGNSLRLRHAYVRLDDLHILGQTWTTFTDATAVPLTVDADGPNSSVTLRSVQLRLARRVGPHATAAVAIESPSADVQVPDSVQQDYQNIPDVVVHYREVRPGLRFQVAGVLRVLSIADVSDQRTSHVGFGGMAMGRWDLSPRDQLGFQFILGRGISRYITGFANRGLDLVFDPTTAAYQPLGSLGAYVAYTRAWKPGVSTNVIAGALATLDEPFFAPDFYRRGGYLAVNHFFPLVAGSRVGGEVVFGRRVNEDGQAGNAARLQALLTYDF